MGANTPSSRQGQKLAWNGEPWKVEQDDGFTRVVFEVADSELQYLVCEFFGSPRDCLRHANMVIAAANRAPVLLAALDPDTLEAIADEIGSEFKHSARADSLRIIARRQRAALAKVQP